ncbi:MAG: metallophosphoesterase [Spirochaetes bacterium]|nr:metallophosphoesterase [Spirochaetota bacterium]
MHTQEKSNTLRNRLFEIYNRENPPDVIEYSDVIDRVNNILLSEDRNIRPYDSSGLPGGIINLKKDIPTIIVPDIHARMDFFINVMLYNNKLNETNLESIATGKLQIVCVGDALHGEKRAAKRWSEAYKEFLTGYEDHSSIDEEMKEGFGVVEMIMEVKNNFPENFHFLKGNHENIANEQGGGNNPFIKFTQEGPMIAYYVEKFYGKSFIDKYYNFEKNLPLLAIGKNFLISHAEPWTFYSRDEILEYRNNSDVVEGLTWTADDTAEDGSVQQMLDAYIEDEEDLEKSLYFGGHRPVRDIYNLRADGRYVQIHNPDKFILAWIEPDNIDLDRDIIELDDNIADIINGIG